MSTKMFKMSIDEAKEELVANERMQKALIEKTSWPELTDREYILTEQRLAECQEEEKVLLSTIDFWEQFQKSLDKKKKSQKFVPIDFTKDSEYKRLFGIDAHKLGIEAFE